MTLSRRVAARAFRTVAQVRPAQVQVRFADPDCRCELRQVHRQAIVGAKYKAGRC